MLQILQLQMNEYKYHYLYTKLDIDAFDLDDFKYNYVNITAFRLVDIDNIGVREIIKHMKRYYQKQQVRPIYKLLVRELKSVEQKS